MSERPDRARLRPGRRLVSIADQGVVSITNFLVTVAVARYESPSFLGAYVLLFGLVFLVHRIHAAVVCMPLTAASAIHGPEALGAEFDGIHLGFVVASLVALVPIALALSLCVLETPLGGLDVASVALGTSALVSQEYLRRKLLAERRYGATLLMSSAFGVLVVGAVVALGALESMNMGALFGVFVFGALPALAVLAHRTVWRDAARAPFTRTWLKARDERGLVLSNAIHWVMAQLVYFVVAAFAGSSAVGVLAAVRNLFGPLNVFLLSLESFMPARLGEVLASGCASKLVAQVVREWLLMFALMVPLGALALGFGKPVIDWLYGIEYGAQTGPMLILAFVLIYSLQLLARVGSIGLRLLGRGAELGTYAFIGLGVLVLAALLLVPPYGAYGGAWALVATDCVVFCLISRALLLRGAG